MTNKLGFLTSLFQLQIWQTDRDDVGLYQAVRFSCNFDGGLCFIASRILVQKGALTMKRTMRDCIRLIQLSIPNVKKKATIVSIFQNFLEIFLARERTVGTKFSPQNFLGSLVFS